MTFGGRQPKAGQEEFRDGALLYGEHQYAA
jgi:hypothetical protein